MRVEPLPLTLARETLEYEGDISSVVIDNTPWYFLSNTPSDVRDSRINELLPIYRATTDHSFTLRIGQALEIAVFRALRDQASLHHFGAFRDLDEHDDSTLYRKEEPPRFVSGKLIASGPLDFLLAAPTGTIAGVEVKNIRPWIYPKSEDLKEFLRKCCSIDAVPVLIARRISYVARSEVC
ncbi:MAG: hypothetical protein ACREUQ_13200, partial [Burkholderiales bacterium]